MVPRVPNGKKRRVFSFCRSAGLGRLKFWLKQCGTFSQINRILRGFQTLHQQFRSSADLDTTDTCTQQTQKISTRYFARIQGSRDESETSHHTPEMNAKHKDVTCFRTDRNNELCCQVAPVTKAARPNIIRVRLRTTTEHASRYEARTKKGLNTQFDKLCVRTQLGLKRQQGTQTD